MARDIRYAQSGDRNKYYKAEYVNQNKLTQNAECEGVFYSVDYEPIKHTVEWINGTQYKAKRVKIVTKDYITNLELDDYVLYNGEYWLVDGLEIEDIEDNAKPFLRHANKTIISLKL